MIGLALSHNTLTRNTCMWQPRLPLRTPRGNIESVSLHEILARARQGDRVAQSRLIDEFYPAVRETVHRELSLDVRRGRPWLAALFSTGDVVHDVFVGVLRDLHTFEGHDGPSFQRFLTATVKHRLIDTIRFHEAARRDGRRVGHDLDVTAADAPSEDTSPIAVALRREESGSVHAALQDLPPRDRAVLELRYLQSKTYPEIAAALGIAAEDTARKAVRAALARLLVKLRARGIDRP